MKSSIYFERLEFNNQVCCFRDQAVIDFSDGQGNWKRWTVILGDNGTGKTTLLQILAAFEFERFVNNNEYFNYSPKGFFEFRSTSSEKDDFLNRTGRVVAKLIKFYKSDNVDEIQKKSVDPPELHFLDYNNIATSVHRYSDLLDLRCFGYGANRSMGKTSLSEYRIGNSETLFKDNIELINAEEWLLQLDYSANINSNIQEYSRVKKEKVKEILIDILPEVKDIRFSSPSKENLIPKVEFLTHLGWVSIQNISLGYKTMVAWIVDLVYRMFERYPESENPLNEAAIVLIDEIDLHLHPKWQRKIFDHLSNKFPATQFIVTAHSPLIVQSAPKDANLVLLRKDGNHIEIDQKLENVRKWRIDQILSSDLFEIPSRNDDVEKMLNRRRELIGKSNLSDTEKEELERLNKEADSLPYAETEIDIEARKIIQKAADYLKSQGTK